MRVLPLDSPRWKQLEHAYGSAADIPPMIRQLIDESTDQETLDEVEDDFWNKAFHQCCCCSALWAAIPHFVNALKRLSIDRQLNRSRPNMFVACCGDRICFNYCIA